MSEPNHPDLRTLEGQLAYLDYHSPDSATAEKHSRVNQATQNFWILIESHLPDGPGKTRTLHAVNDARMQANNCIANKGA